MAEGRIVTAADARDAFLNPIAKVKEFFESVSELRSASQSPSGSDERVLQACENVSTCGEHVVLCLEQQIRQHNRATEARQEIAGAFKLGLRRIIYLRKECEDVKHFLRDLKLADQNIDMTKSFPTPPPSASTTSRNKHRNPKDFTGSGVTSGSMSHAMSFDDLRRERDVQLSSRRSVDSFSGMKKAKSESDVAIQSLKKKVEGLTVDNSKLRDSEKKLIKQKIKLTRTCKTLEKERDCAEDRLKIEQTQRDSIEKLRKRNKELEDQLRVLCDSQVLRERDTTTEPQKSSAAATT